MCSFGAKADAELNAQERTLPAPLLKELRAQWTANVKIRLGLGYHPEQVKLRTLRALPVAKLPGILVFFVYIEESQGITVLHVTVARGPNHVVPALPRSAWAVAQQRLESGVW